MQKDLTSFKALIADAKALAAEATELAKLEAAQGVLAGIPGLLTIGTDNATDADMEKAGIEMARLLAIKVKQNEIDLLAEEFKLFADEQGKDESKKDKSLLSEKVKERSAELFAKVSKKSTRKRLLFIVAGLVLLISAGLVALHTQKLI